MWHGFVNRLLGVALVGNLVVAGCTTYQPHPDRTPFESRVETRSEGEVTVTAAALTPDESEAVFGVPLADDGIQPVWLAIENREDRPYWLAPRALDPMYFSPAEVAYRSRWWFSDQANDAMAVLLREQAVPYYVAPRATVSGYAYTTLDHFSKVVNVELIGDRQMRSFQFVLAVPSLEADFEELDLDALYTATEISDLDEQELRSTLESLPCCVTNEDGSENGDPLNFVLIGDEIDIHLALVRAGWDETERLTAGSALRTGANFLSGSQYLHSPVSALYVFGRPQDAAFQKARATIDERNHLRLWLTPYRHNGERVWIGQISRDIGVKATTKTWSFTTHAIDPGVDYQRWYLVQDLMAAQALRALGFVRGVGESSAANPRSNLTGDPYVTDGLRAVLFVADQPTRADEVELTGWIDPVDAEARARLLEGD